MAGTNVFQGSSWAGILRDAVQIIPGRFFFLSVTGTPWDTQSIHFFSTDHTFQYEPFFADFGPLSLSCIYKYAKLLESKLKEAEERQKILIHYSSIHPERRANAALLIGAAQMLLFGVTAQEAYRPFLNISPRFVPFRDATCGPCSFKLTILDCLKGLEFAMKLGWFDYKTFNVDEYDYYEKLKNGDMNWIIPNRILAFSCPSSATGNHDGYTTCTPEDYVDIFNRMGIKTVIRLNKKQYDARKFTDRNIEHVDLFFVDGTCPSREIIQAFLQVVENRDHPIAVHCKAGLGRTGTLIGCYAVKNFKFPAVEWIGWNRLCRPGSILGPQQQFLTEIQHELLQMTRENSLRTRRIHPPQSSTASTSSSTGHKDDLADCLAKLSLDSRRVAEYGDAGQGERLLVAKRQQQAGLLSAASSTSSSANVIETGSQRKILPLPLLLSRPLSSNTTPFCEVRKGQLGTMVNLAPSKCASTVATPGGGHNGVPSSIAAAAGRAPIRSGRSDH
ncbi:putative dual specificity protein phosphatase CDC14A [Neospora caninum Liverpool]|uniref:protein-tyrosine-phosphatase n=1 Tax=Neospora caninum (strain Liverpool) TaxID=572307 RepID=F0VNN1_NEOCL|nr:putative dual specificity protein phosphatase CDC14A [Neospora caninum Liverpool]CBZ55327.1 putative dual specificity protein phosphatase CDC14A [Neospora caninum Liverpool]CEL70059.1 TPA: dual specificity protein phosphatase CDC14A,putative [Neospora caninum Liverpool]|eukprot:XP_003885355.1 putative dual specificity protein phosphatase CDC14A [Neospora caninum Liverpool]